MVGCHFFLKFGGEFHCNCFCIVELTNYLNSVEDFEAQHGLYKCLMPEPCICYRYVPVGEQEEEEDNEVVR